MKYIFESESLNKLVQSNTLEEFLNVTAPEYKKVVPIYWLQLERPSRSVQFKLSSHISRVECLHIHDLSAEHFSKVVAAMVELRESGDLSKEEKVNSSIPSSSCP